MKWPQANPTQVPFLHGLHLDGYCKTLTSKRWPNGVAFEADGEQHRKPHKFFRSADANAVFLKQKRRDWRKNVQCWRHGVKLIRVPYVVKNREEYIVKRLNGVGCV